MFVTIVRRQAIFSSIGEFALKPEPVRSVGDLTTAYLAWRKDRLGNAKAVMKHRKAIYRDRTCCVTVGKRTM